MRQIIHALVLLLTCLISPTRNDIHFQRMLVPLLIAAKDKPLLRQYLFDDENDLTLKRQRGIRHNILVDV